MTDRELLEAAAKAAGITVRWERDPAFIQERWQAMVPCGWVGQPSEREWNPLREDGDALRLLVKLRLDLHVDATGAMAVHFSGGFEEDAKYDIYAATRRAIVRAAAALGGQS